MQRIYSFSAASSVYPGAKPCDSSGSSPAAVPYHCASASNPTPCSTANRVFGTQGPGHQKRRGSTAGAMCSGSLCAFHSVESLDSRHVCQALRVACDAMFAHSCTASQEFSWKRAVGFVSYTISRPRPLLEASEVKKSNRHPGMCVLAFSGCWPPGPSLLHHALIGGCRGLVAAN